MSSISSVSTARHSAPAQPVETKASNAKPDVKADKDRDDARTNPTPTPTPTPLPPGQGTRINQIA